MAKKKIPAKYKWKVLRPLKMTGGKVVWDYYETKAKAKRLGFSNIIRKR